MSFFGNRLNVTFDWYDKRTSDLLRERNIAPSSGYDKMWVNDGEIRNRGIELTIDGVAFQNRDWRVGGTFVFSRNRNKVLSLGNAVQTGLRTDLRTGMQYEYYGNQSEQFRAYTNILAVGQPMYVFYGYRTDGIVQSLAEGLSAGLSGDDAQPGEFKYVDIYDGDGLETVDENDMCIIGDPNPDFIYGLTNTFTWKDLSLSIFIQGSYGNDIFNVSRMETEGMYDGKNQSTEVLKRWRIPGQITNVPKANFNIKNSTYFVEDGSYLRVKDISLSYNIRCRQFKKWGISRVQPYFTASNLLTWTSYSGMDPEVNQYGNSGSVQGIDYGTYPQSKSFVFGINVEF